MSLYDDVYGLTYRSAAEQTSLLTQSISQQAHKGFGSKEELVQWAHDNQLDKVMYHSMSHKFMCVSHKGEIMTPQAFQDYYGDVLFYEEKIGSRIITNRWVPEGFEYYDRAYIAGEQGDGVHRPLYYRSYFIPTGFYSTERDAFNVAKPFPVFARETGRDTSHIYTYIEHVAGECAMWLLAWLRAKLLYPTVKTQVVPIIVSKTQGSGKTSFAEVICKGLFGKDNVLVTDQYDSQARFNADYADALIVCQEEKEEIDKRNPAGTLKSRATATTIRKEQKGVDPIYQESYTDFIMTTNKDVPIKFDGREDQRRFMIMEADEHFTRKESALADEIFTKLYGYDANYNRKGTPFVEDRDLIAQFEHELFMREDIANVQLRNFPKTAAYNRCFTLPRTNEATEIESIIRALAPFIHASLTQEQIVRELDDMGSLSTIVPVDAAIQFFPGYKETPKMVAVCRPLVFVDTGTNKPMAHSMVERGIYDCNQWMIEEFGIKVLPDMNPIPGGFTNIAGRYKMAPAARFVLDEPSKYKVGSSPLYMELPKLNEGPGRRVGERMRIDKNWRLNPNGCFETVNEMKPGTRDLKNKTLNVQYMDTFLLESDEPTSLQRKMEEKRAEKYKLANGDGATIQARDLYRERLDTAYVESMRLFNEGIVARVVYSGAKSYHLLIRVKDPPDSIDEYKWLHGYLCSTVSDRLSFDISTADPARLTRSPLSLSRVTTAYGLVVEAEQELVCEDWSHVYDIPWRAAYQQWLGRPLKPYEQKNGHALMPTKQEYRDAMEAVIDGTFWTNTKYDGERQRLFFPAYRLLRLLGYSHNELWDGGIMTKGLENYRKREEISYWRTRGKSSVVAAIDRDIDEYNAQFEEDTAAFREFKGGEE